MKLNIRNILLIAVASFAFIFLISTLVLVTSIIDSGKKQAEIDEFALAHSQPENFKETVINEFAISGNDEVETINYRAGFKYEYVYEGIHFLTSADKWNEDRLQGVAEELFANTHGDEIKYVEAVILDNNLGYRYSCDFASSNVSYEIPISYFNLFPEKSIFYDTYKKSYLTIYGVANITLVEDIAQPLSQAYGYHYVSYYMNLTGTEEDKETEYFNLRAADNENIRFEITCPEDFDDYKDNYIWYLYEIAANDYMYLMGSETAHRINGVERENAVNREDFYKENEIKTWRKWNYYYRNYIPHENVVLPLPDSVDGLSEYFYSFISEEVPEHYEHDIDISEANFRLSTDRGLWLLYEWDEVFGEDAVYRVVYYNEFDDFVFAHAENRAHLTDIPTVALRYKWVSKYTSDYEDGKILKARLCITFPDGSVYLSEPILAIIPD